MYHTTHHSFNYWSVSNLYLPHLQMHIISTKLLSKVG